MKLAYPAIFSPCEEDSGYTVVFPDLPGCVTEGDSFADAILMAEDAAGGWLLSQLEDGEKIPAATPAEKLILSQGEFVNVLAFDTEVLAEKYGGHLVQKNLAIPAWLNTAAERRGVNFSQVLARALQQELEMA